LRRDDVDVSVSKVGQGRYAHGPVRPHLYLWLTAKLFVAWISGADVRA
jgi:hypothetical protein